MIEHSIVEYEEKRKGKDSKILVVLITLYMSSVLLFSENTVLNAISQVLFLVAFGGCSIYMMMHGKNFKVDICSQIIACFVAFCFVSTMWATDRNSAISRVITLCQLFLMELVLMSYISNYENIEKIVKGFIVAGVLCSITVIGYYGISEYIRLMTEGVRLGGEINNENSIGLYTSTSAIMCFYFAYCKKEKLFYVVMLLPILVAMGSGSRKALVLVIIGIIALIFMQYRREARLSSFVKLLAAIVVVVIVVRIMSQMEIFTTVFSRFEVMFSSNGTKDNSTLLRESMVQFGMDYFKQHPYTGIGIGNSYIITRDNIGWETYLHNNYVELLASVGIFGTLIYYGMYLYLIKELYKLAFRENDNMAILMLTLLVGNIIMDYGAVSYYSKTTYIYIAMAAATVSIGKRRMIENVEQEIEENN